jgi:hypothetical protein
MHSDRCTNHQNQWMVTTTPIFNQFDSNHRQSGHCDILSREICFALRSELRLLRILPQCIVTGAPTIKINEWSPQLQFSINSTQTTVNRAIISHCKAIKASLSMIFSACHVLYSVAQRVSTPIQQNQWRVTTTPLMNQFDSNHLKTSHYNILQCDICCDFHSVTYLTYILAQ